MERSTLKPLPDEAYQIKNYTRAKVQQMGYVYFSPDKSYYSVPYRYIGKYTQIHSTARIVEVYFNHKRIALHQREGKNGAYITIKDHLSSSHQYYNGWSVTYFKNLAKRHGASVMMFVEQLIHQSPHPEVGYKRAMGVIQLHKKYGSERLDNACQRAIYGNALSYNRVKNILVNNLDKEYQDQDIKELNNKTSHIPAHNNIRGAEFYN